MITAPVTLTKINTEFGRPMTTPLSAYRGFRVFDNNAGSNRTLPTVGRSIKYSDFLNKSRAIATYDPPTVTFTQQPPDRSTFTNSNDVTFVARFSVTRNIPQNTNEIVPNRFRTLVTWEESNDNGATWGVVKTEPNISTTNPVFTTSISVTSDSGNNGNLYRVKVNVADSFYNSFDDTETTLISVIRTSRIAKLTVTTASADTPICLNVGTLRSNTVTLTREDTGTLLSAGSGSLTFTGVTRCEQVTTPQSDVVDTGWLTVNVPWRDGISWDTIWWSARRIFDDSKTTSSFHAQPTTNVLVTNTVTGYRQGVDAAEIVDYGIRILAESYRYGTTRLRFIPNPDEAPTPPTPSFNDRPGFGYLGIPTTDGNSANPRRATATVGPGWAAWESGATQANLDTRVLLAADPSQYTAGFSLLGMTEDGYRSFLGTGPEVLEWWKKPAFSITGGANFGVQTSRVWYVQVRIKYRPRT